MLPDPIFLNIHMYGVMIAVGILCAFLVLFYLTKKKGVDVRFTDFIFYNGIASIVVGFGFATLFQSTYNYIKNPSVGFELGSGMTFIGGLIGGVACFLAIYFIFRKKYTTRLYEVISLLPCSILIAHAFGRIGCFFCRVLLRKGNRQLPRRTVSRPSTSRASYAALRGSVLICAVRCERIPHFEKGLQAQLESVSYSIRRISVFNRICTRR